MKAVLPGGHFIARGLSFTAGTQRTPGFRRVNPIIKKYVGLRSCGTLIHVSPMKSRGTRSANCSHLTFSLWIGRVSLGRDKQRNRDVWNKIYQEVRNDIGFEVAAPHVDDGEISTQNK